MAPRFSDKLSAPKVSASGDPLPLARVVSRTIHPDEGVHEHAGTVMVVAWGQFMDHDLTLTATPLGKCTPEVIKFLRVIWPTVLKFYAQTRWTGMSPKSAAAVRTIWKTNIVTRYKYRKTIIFTGTTMLGVKISSEPIRVSDPTVN